MMTYAQWLVHNRLDKLDGLFTSILIDAGLCVPLGWTPKNLTAYDLARLIVVNRDEREDSAWMEYRTKHHESFEPTLSDAQRNPAMLAARQEQGK